MSKKVYLNKSDSVASAIDKVINAPDEEVILYIPRDAGVAKSKKDIQLLKREVEASGKNIIVESVDDDILERVATSGIRATNPFLGRNKHTVSDIVVVRPKRRTSPRNQEESVAKKKRSPKASKVRVGTVRSSISSPAGGMKKLFIVVGVVASVTVVVTLAVASMPRVSVDLMLNKLEEGYIGALRVSPLIEESSVDDEIVKLRGVFSAKKKNITKSYPATGTDTVGRKARGTITIYNNFSSESQTLVKTTRFTTPDGKIYRLDQNVTVPGTKEGSEPSSIEVSVTADQPGEEYNVKSVPKLRIPGFQGSAKYEGFYGESERGMTGGATGEVKVPTGEDLKMARADAERALEEILKAELFIDMPEGIKILEGSYGVVITREQVNDVVNKNDEFSITLYGEMQLVGFSEEELIETLRGRFSAQAEKELMNYSYEIDYGKVVVDFEAQVFDSAINLESEWIEPFSVDEFKEKVAGMTENQLKEAVFSTPGVSKGEVRMWPFWVNRVPQNIDRITVDAG